MSQLPLVASLISSIIGSPVKTHDECVNNGLTIEPSQILDFDAIYKRSLIRIELDPTKVTFPSSKIAIQIFIKPIVGDSKSMIVDPNITILELKHAIHAVLGTEIEAMRLIFAGKHLDDQKTLTSYDINKGCTIQVLTRVVGGGPDFYVITNNLLDPPYDYDFTNLKDNEATFIRGRELYKRPCGWKRIALNVGKYGDGTWLGSVGNSPHEWPVSYHGTKKESADSIANEGFLVSRGTRFAYGRGIYSSPEISVAEGYAQEFVHNNVRYKLVFQNRVNPVGLQKHVNDTYWVTPKDEDIRPYGICIKTIQ
ncbi:hypothetical protein C1646_691669 [Rhizophagus diaphanus]|nr:hypothetical protein C1646_691669 [Rhizophagus diaphanus] [Rhizophagus sp. MUCL 43196]